MAPMFQDEDSSLTSLSPNNYHHHLGSPPTTYPWLKDLKSEERGLYLIHLLLTCAGHVSSGSLEHANAALDQISLLASPDGDAMQRVAAYFTAALADRILRSWPGLHRALNSTKTSLASDELLAGKIFSDLFPFLRAASAVTNQAILEAAEGERMVHVVDLHAATAADPAAQWSALLQELSLRPDGPPHLRITAVHGRREILDQMAHRLSDEAERLDIPFQFNPVLAEFENLDFFDKLKVKTGEALVVTSVLRLHTLLGSRASGNRSDSRNLSPDSVVPWGSSGIEGFLSSLWGLGPKLVVVTERDSDHNGEGLVERLVEALHTYAALFDCLESTRRRSAWERAKVERLVLGEEIKNIIACEGAERRERHERLEKWAQRLESGGFENMPVSRFGLSQAGRVLQGYGCDGFRISESDGNVLICWEGRALYSVSAWRCRE